MNKRRDTALMHYPGNCVRLWSLILFLPLVLVSCGFSGIVTIAG